MWFVPLPYQRVSDFLPGLFITIETFLLDTVLVWGITIYWGQSYLGFQLYTKSEGVWCFPTHSFLYLTEQSIHFPTCTFRQPIHLWLLTLWLNWLTIMEGRIWPDFIQLSSFINCMMTSSFPLSFSILGTLKISLMLRIKSILFSLDCIFSPSNTGCWKAPFNAYYCFCFIFPPYTLIHL